MKPAPIEALRASEAFVKMPNCHTVNFFLLIFDIFDNFENFKVFKIFEILSQVVTSCHKLAVDPNGSLKKRT